MEQIGKYHNPILLENEILDRSQNTESKNSLSKVEEERLIWIIRNNNSSETEKMNARTELVLKFQYLVNRNAQKFRENETCSKEDYIQEGNIGLLESIEKHDPKQGPLAGFAQFFIYRRILDFLWQMQGVTKISTWCVIEVHRRVKDTCAWLLPPIKWDIKMTTHDLSYDYWRFAHWYASIYRISLDKKMIRWGDWVDAAKIIWRDYDSGIVDVFSPDPGELVSEKDIYRVLRILIQQLSPDEQYYINSFYGIDGTEEIPPSSVAEDSGVKRNTITKTRLRAIAKIREKLIELETMGVSLEIINTPIKKSRSFPNEQMKDVDISSDSSEEISWEWTDTKNIPPTVNQIDAIVNIFKGKIIKLEHELSNLTKQLQIWENDSVNAAKYLQALEDKLGEVEKEKEGCLQKIIANRESFLRELSQYSETSSTKGGEIYDTIWSITRTEQEKERKLQLTIQRLQHTLLTLGERIQRQKMKLIATKQGTEEEMTSLKQKINNLHEEKAKIESTLDAAKKILTKCL